MKITIPALFVLVLLTGFSLQIQSQTTSPVLILPKDQEKDISRTPSFTWDEVPGVTDYIIAVMKKVDDVEVIHVTTTSNSYKSDTILEANTTYIWTVEGISTTAITGQWSEKRQFTTGNE